MPRHLAALLAFVGIVAAVATLASLSTLTAPATYATLQGPVWAPPAWVFAPVWTVLYGLIAVAGWLAWRAGVRGAGMAAYGVQLALNGLWSPLFFALQLRGPALACILALDAAVATTLLLFWRHQRTAALLLLPYLLWVLFATTLNWAYWSLNR